MKAAIDPITEHAVIVSLRMEIEDISDMSSMQALTDRITMALARVRGGEFGGLSMRGGYCLLYCYGIDAEEVYSAITPALFEFEPDSGSWVIKRFGAATDTGARRERIEIGG